MKTHVDFKECLKDSPRFRESLEEAENDIDLLESHLDRLVKLCGTMIDTGKTYSTASFGFISGIRDVAGYFEDDNMTQSCLNKFASALEEMQKYHNILLDQAYRSVCKNLTDIIRSDIRKVKETRKHFEKISDEMDGALYKNSQAPKSKTQECEDAYNVLTAMKSCFSHTALDYVFQINVLHSEKRFGILETMLSFMHAENTFFHQGNDLFCDLESYMKSIAAQVEDLTAKASAEKKEMEQRHTLVQERPVLGIEVNLKSDIPLEGYLFKRTSNAFKTWVRRWFRIENSQLVYRKRTKDILTIMEEDLRLCNIKPIGDIERRFCFEVLSPTRSHMLQADSETECMAWVNAIQASINHAFSDIRNSITEEVGINEDLPISNNNASDVKYSSVPRTNKRREQILSIAGNSLCCDCRSSNPCWASINLGITLCIECSGIHRSLGVHMSKVRSITLDSWEPELMKVMVELGNDVVNKIYEAKVDENIAARPTPDSNRDVREKWIKAKYVQRAFLSKLPGTSEGRPGSTKIRSWSVCRTTRRSPSRNKPKKKRDKIDKSDNIEDITDVLKDEHLRGDNNITKQSVCGFNEDPDVDKNRSDVMLFGVDTRDVEVVPSLEIESSEDSIEEGVDDDSVVPWEDVSKLDPNTLMFKAAQARNLPVMLEALGHRASINWNNNEDNGRTALMTALETGSLAACEFLLLNGAGIENQDHEGRTALHIATQLGHTAQVCQLLKRGAKQNVKDNNGNDPLSIAVAAANADIVTLLRLSKLNEEMKETDGSFQQGDDTFNDVFRDFTNIASYNPEKLVRK